MRLLDQIVQANLRHVTIEHPHLGRRVFPAAATMKDQILAVPLRYVLEDDVTEFCKSTVATDAATLAAARSLVRIPGGKVWVEWREKSPERLKDASAPAIRIGALIHAADDGRSGSMTLFSEGPPGNDPDMLQARLIFDLDCPATPDGHDQIGLSAPESPHLEVVLHHCKAELVPEWSRYFSDMGPPRTHADEVASRIAPTFLIVATFFLLMNQTPCFSSRKSELGPLNVCRRKAGKQALLEHVEVRLQLSAQEPQLGRAQASRQQCRLHGVRGHFFVRGGKLIWRRAHLRGRPELGTLRSRTVTVGRLHGM